MTEESMPHWDLTRLYQDPADPQLTADLEGARERVARFRERYRGRVDDALGAAELAEILEDYQQLQRLGLRPYFYAQLRFASDATDDANKALMARVREAWSAQSEELLFFELELLRLSDAAYARLLASDAAAPYRHYLENLRAHASYVLDEAVERAIKRKDLTGKDGFVQLYEEVTGALRFRFTLPGEEAERDVTGEELLALLYHPDPGLREKAFGGFLTGHAEHATVLTACFNNLLLDHARECELRGFPDIMTPTHLDHETDGAMVEQLMAVSEANYPLAQEYFALKRELLGLEVLKNTDLYAPVEASPKQYSFASARKMVLDAFASFSPVLADAAAAFFSDARIDVPPAPGKSGGAFCQGMMPGELPYVLVNFTGTLRDVTTLAHELGHGVHFVLSQKQNLYHYQAPLPFAETASVFGEMLLTRSLLEREEDRATRIALLCTKLEEMIATTFRQNVLTRFELAAHRRRAEGLLSPDDYCDLWWRENAKLFGNQVSMIEPYRWGWSYISHFIHARFYCTSYVFGELLVLALYQRYRAQGEGFVPLYLELLGRGGSAHPRELLEPFGIDLGAPDFWQQGYDLVRELLDELKGLVAGA